MKGAIDRSKKQALDKVITLRLTADEYEALNKLCETNEVEKSNLIRNLIKDVLK